VLVQEQRQC